MSLKEQLIKERLPQHVAVIMDGNGRWAKSRGFLRAIGHENGVDALRKTSTTAAELGIKFLTVYAFSSENWNRPKSEVNALMTLLVSSLKNELKTLTDNKIRLNAIGNLDSLPPKCHRELMEVMDKTKTNEHMTLTLALSYGSKEELTKAIQAIAEKVASGSLLPNDINQDTVEEHLSTAGMPHPDLLIRTSGENRISNFMLWQIAYSELFFSEKLWPDFKEEDFYAALVDYQNRERRFGKISEQIKP